MGLASHCDVYLVIIVLECSCVLDLLCIATLNKLDIVFASRRQIVIDLGGQHIVQLCPAALRHVCLLLDDIWIRWAFARLGMSVCGWIRLAL